LKRLFLMMMTGVLAVALVACADNGNDDGLGIDDPTPAPTADVPATPADPTPSDPTPAPTDPATPGDPVDYEQAEELAPIDELEVLFLESDPVQHRLRVVSGLPSGCAFFERIDVERDDTTFNVTVVNLMPAPGVDVACTMIYGYHESEVELGDDLEAGTEYTVNVNDETITFVAE
jgi:hypothetical protein